MYKLFSRVEGGLACMVKCMSGHLRETGMYNTVIYDIHSIHTYISKLLCKAVRSVYSMIQLPLCIS